MKSTISATALFAGAALAAAVRRQETQNLDPVVLNFALTLEHLEDTFYHEALAKFTASDLMAAGAPEGFYENLEYIASDEATHVKEITDVINADGSFKPVQACTYNFPYSDAKGFLGLATILEGVGTSAYLGAAGLITSKDYLTAAGSILVSEALHTSLLRSTTGLVPNANPNGTPLDPTSVFSLAAPFFKECPKENPALPFTAFPAATAAAAGALDAGNTLGLSTEADVPQGSYLTFVSGLAVVSVQGQASGKNISAAVPKEASGQTYVLITKKDVTEDGGKLKDTNVVAGPVIIEVNPAAPAGGDGYEAPAPSASASSPAAPSQTGGSTPGAGMSAGSGSNGTAPSASAPSASAPVPYTGAASRIATGGVALIAVIATALLM